VLTRQYAKLCDVVDFDDVRLSALMDEAVPSLPAGQRHRKSWEIAMAAAFLEDVGCLDAGRRVLDVGAGNSPFAFWLASRQTHAVAIDIYGRGPFAAREAPASMLEDPGSHAPPIRYDRDLVSVRDMDGRELEFPDAAFDAVVSLSSIEHFGGRRGVAQAAREMGRVLRPGGHAFIVTESFVDHGVLERAPVQFAARLVTFGRRCATATPRQRGIDVLTRREIQRLIVQPSGLRLLQPLSWALSARTFDGVVDLGGPDARPITGDDPGPHVLLRTGTSLFTSVGLPLVKPC
jgi:ubiquinone/menaquinone biosynthesis C-methylase UbiE